MSRSTRPCCSLAGMGFIVLLGTQNPGEMIGSIVMLVMALPFLAVFYQSKGQSWAIIPAGIFATLALIIPFATAVGEDTLAGRLVAGALFLGFALPFGWLWWRRDQHATNWARYPLAGLLLAAIVSVVFGTVIENSWPIVLIVLGVWLLYDNLRQPRLKS